jgi:diaminopimelate epimerase
MVATGNDFVVVDNRLQFAGYRLQVAPRPCSGSLGEGSRERLPAGRQECRGTGCRLQELAKKLCDRKTGVGADGLLVLEKSKKADFKMRIFNPDGSEPDMCGNGSRCIALYAKNKKIASASMSIETTAGILYAHAGKDKVKINMTAPNDIKLSMDLSSMGKAYKFHYINTGVPHTIFFTRNLEKIDLGTFGKNLRYHKAFSPDGTNVDIVRVEKGNSLSIRTYERGVEAETLACGTGAVASAILSHMIKGVASPANVHTRGGKLKIYFKGNREEGFKGVFLEGQAKEVFSGKIKV